MQFPLLRSARGDINRLPCVFAPALRARCAVCSLANQQGALPREKILCTQPLARASCANLNGMLREKSRFALGLRSNPLGGRGTAVAAGSTTLRSQCGGLSGLHQVLDADAHAIDVQRILERLNVLPGGLDALPWPEIMRAIARWRP